MRRGMEYWRKRKGNEVFVRGYILGRRTYTIKIISNHYITYSEFKYKLLTINIILKS